jgi:predicted porin
MNIKFTLAAAASLIATTLPAQIAPLQVTANTNIVISGLLSVGIKDSQVSQGNAAVNRQQPSEFHVDDNTSRLIISSVSKITDGWNVIFRLESRFTANVRPGDPLLPSYAGTNTVYGGGTAAGLAVNDASGFADGDTWGGVSSPFGTIVAGKSTLYYTDTISSGYLGASLEAPGEGQRIWDANGLATFNVLSTYLTGARSATTGVFTPTTKQILGNTRSRNVVRYDSPIFKLDDVSTLNFSLAYSKNPAGSDPIQPLTPPYSSTYDNGNAVYAKVAYIGHGFTAMGSYLDQRYSGVPANAANSELKANRLGVSYKIEGFKFGLIYDHTDQVNGIATGTALSDAKRTAFLIPLSFQWDKHGVYFNYGQAGNTSSMDNTGMKQYNLIYDYALTPRAFLGVYWTDLKNDSQAFYQPFLTGYSPFGGSNILAGESWKQVGVILNYWF